MRNMRAKSKSKASNMLIGCKSAQAAQIMHKRPASCHHDIRPVLSKGRQLVFACLTLAATTLITISLVQFVPIVQCATTTTTSTTANNASSSVPSLAADHHHNPVTLSSSKPVANQTAPAATSVSAALSQGKISASRSSSSSSKLASTKSQASAQVEQQQTQATDLSSMYVQIPIAEPIDAPSSSSSSSSDGSDNNSAQQASIDASTSSDSGEASSGAKATTWKGPWPKKFQIGYIKQSDLHQVLIESLKNDPFVGTGTSSGKPIGKTVGKAANAPVATTPLPSASKSATASKLQQQPAEQQIPQLKPVQQQAANQWQQAPKTGNFYMPVGQVHLNLPRNFNSNNNNNRQYQFNNGQQQQQHFGDQFQRNNQQQQFRLHADVNNRQQQFPTANLYNQHAQMQNILALPMQHQHQQQHHQQQQYRTNSNQQFAASGSHQNRPLANIQQQQVQFASFPTASMKNQPIYTLNGNNNNNNNQYQSQLDQEQLQLIQITGSSNQQQQQQLQTIAGRPQKASSDYYGASWRPVTATDSDQAPQLLSGGKTSPAINPTQQQLISDVNASNGLNDGFDDGFGMPNVKDLPSGGSATSGASSANLSMNRHPVLNNFLSSSSSSSSSSDQLAGGNGKTWPTKTLKGTQMTSAGVKGAKSAPSGTKSLNDDDDNDDAAAGTKGEMDRRAVNSPSDGSIKTRTSTTTTTTTTTSAPNATATTTASSSITTTSTSTSTSTTPMPIEQTTSINGNDSTSSTPTTPQDNSSTTSDDAGVNTTMPSTTQSALINGQGVTSSPSEGADLEPTTEPDSEIVEPETSEPGDDSNTTTTTTTTTASSLASSGSRLATTPSSMTTGGDSGSQEVDQIGGQTTAGGGQNDATSTTTTQRSREETTPASLMISSTTAPSEQLNSAEVEGSTSSSGASSTPKTDAGSLSDEALMAAAVRATSDISKSAVLLQQQQQGTKSSSGGEANSKQRARNLTAPVAQKAPVSTRKQARSSERLVQASMAVATATNASNTSNSGKKTATPSTATGVSNKLITKRPQAAATSKSAAKQRASGAKGAGNAASASGKLANSKKRVVSGQNKASSSGQTKKSGQKTTRMVQTSAKLQQQQPQQATQIVSMSAAQAQTTAQTLASLLLSRCLNSANCAHLLDICTTKQAAVPWPSQSELVEVANATTTSSSSSNNQLARQRRTGTNNANTTTTSDGWSMPIGLMSSHVMSLMQTLQADKALRMFPAWKDTVETIVDQDTQAGYTLIMPSNEAMDRLPMVQIDALLANADQMSQLIDNHIIDTVEGIDLPIGSNSNKPAAIASRYIRSKGLQVNQHRDRMVTINGKRVVYANQPAPFGGRIHVIDGLLDWPGNLNGPTAASNSVPGSTKLLDIMDTLKQCDKFDGFVTLAEGTGLNQILKQDGPMTVFVPSNEALRKIPDDELEIIKNNSTALKEFLMYHVANGSYFSQDLRDGQQLASILDMKPIQVGVRVDGCSRRLVEANTSPMRRPDIVAKNGVIHILDWYLTVRDNDWCDPIGRSIGGSGASSTSTSASSISSQSNQLTSASINSVDPNSNSLTSTTVSSERLQSLASDQHQVNQHDDAAMDLALTANTYATRVTNHNLPANHKMASTVSMSSIAPDATSFASSMQQASTVAMQSGEQQQQQQQPVANTVYISSIPIAMSDINRASRW